MAYTSILDITEILGEYSKEIDNELYEEAKEIAKDGAKKLRSTKTTYKVRTGKYNKGWTTKIEKGFGTVEAVIYNKTQYQLTHLLEYGHDYVDRNGHRKANASKPYTHIRPVEEECNKDFEEKVTRKIEAGL